MKGYNLIVKDDGFILEFCTNLVTIGIKEEDKDIKFFSNRFEVMITSDDPNISSLVSSLNLNEFIEKSLNNIILISGTDDTDYGVMRTLIADQLSIVYFTRLLKAMINARVKSVSSSSEVYQIKIIEIK